MAEATINVDLGTVATEKLIEELERRSGEDDEVWEFYKRIGEEAIEDFTDGQVAVALGELEELNDLFWTVPERAPAQVRAWLQRITGRV